MRLNDFRNLWEKAYGTGCTVEKTGNRIKVSFEPKGRLYTYTGSFYSVAERLNLIEEIDIQEEAARVAEILKRGNEAIGYGGISDTIRFENPDLIFTYSENDLDEFGRILYRYIPQQEDKWL